MDAGEEPPEVDVRRAAKRDKNESALVRRLEAYGFLVLPNNAKGRPDLCLLRNGTTVWCEVKMPGESFTPEQVDTFSAMRAKGVPVYVLETVEDVDALARDALAPWTGTGITVRDAKKVHVGTRPHKPGHSRARQGYEVCTAPFCVRSRAPGLDTCAMCAGKGKR